MISLRKWLMGPWEQVRGYLIEDLESIETQMNRRWAATFTDSNQLKVSVLLGQQNATATLPAGSLLGRGTPLAGVTQSLAVDPTFLFLNTTQVYNLGAMLSMAQLGQGVA